MALQQGANLNYNTIPIDTKSKLKALVKDVAGKDVYLDAETEELLLSLAKEFVESSTEFACKLTKHRGGEQLAVKDLAFHLEKNWDIKIPGFMDGQTKHVQSTPSVEHNKRITWTRTALNENKSSKEPNKKRKRQ